MPTVTTFAFRSLDGGRVTVNAAFAAVLAANGLDTFDAVWDHTGGAVAKNLLKERTTTRLDLTDADGRACVVYLKRHSAPPWKEFVKPLLRLTWPILGARNEWNAILRFHEAGIPTMTPVALGTSGRRSFLITAAIEGCRKLSHELERRLRVDGPGGVRPERPLIATLARTARTMHAAGLHHQDFYLTHLLTPEAGGHDPLYVIDLGRVKRKKSLGARWIVKDLAQLNYSARGVAAADRWRFFEEYLGRRPTAADRTLLWRVLRKTDRIARHSKKNAL